MAKKSVEIEASLLDKLYVPDSSNPDEDYRENGFFVRDGKYFTKTSIGKGRLVDTEISNFVMKSLFNMVNGTNNSSRIIYIQRKTGEKILIEVKSSELKPESFETILKTHNGCTFLGQPHQLKRIFALLMDEEKTSIIIEAIGWNKEYRFFAFANAIFARDYQLLRVDQMGMVQFEGKHFYLPFFGLANKDNETYFNQRKYKFMPGTLQFKEWANLFYSSSGDNALIGILYRILATFRDVVFDHLGFFPFLFLFGNWGAGKSQFVNRLLKLEGNDTIGTPLNTSTTTGLNREASARTNSLVYFKEFNELSNSEAENFILPGYDGAGKKTGVKSSDNTTKDYPINSAIIFDGNELPAKANILSRMVLLEFEKSTFTNEEKKAFDKLKKHADEGFGNVLLEVFKCREIVEQNFKSTFPTCEAEIEESRLKDAERRTIQHAALLLTIYRLLSNFLPFPFEDFLVKETIIINGLNINNLLRRTSVTTIFWEAFSNCLKKNELFKYETSLEAKSAIYRIKNDDLYQESPILQIKYTNFYPYYTRYCRDNNFKSLDSNSLLRILTAEGYQYFRPSTQKGRGRAYTDKNFGSCYQFILKPSEDNSNVFYLDNVELIM